MELSTNNINKLQISDFLGTELKCECGRTHRFDVEHIVIENDAIKKIPNILKKLGFKNILMISDTNTYKIAGKAVETILNEEKFQYKKFVYEVDKDLVPNEEAIGSLFIEVEKDTDVILAVGSGVLNDLSKFVSYKLGIESIIVSTAPSMDGYASDSSALIVDNLKTTFVSHCPKAIIGDVSILKEAPMEMILAGLGDIIGKYSALCDWKLSEIINGEYYCEVVAELVRGSLEKCSSNVEGIKNRNDVAIKNLMEGLILTGIAMSYIGNTRPASGAEHHMAHYWEMMFLFEGKKALLHGTKVGITTIIITKLRELLSETKIDFNEVISKVDSFDQNVWEEKVIKLYKKAAPGIISLNTKNQINSIEKRLERIKIVREKFDEIISSIKQTPSSETIKSILKNAGAPVTPKEVGVDDEIVVNSVCLAKEVRIRYTILQLLWDLGLLDEFSYKIKDYLNLEA